MNETNPAPILPARLDWPSAIGNFLLNFGTLHYVIVDLLQKTLGAAEFERYRKQPLKEQVVRVQQHLKDRNFPAEKQHEFANLMTRLDSMRLFRNHIAHGYMTVLQEAGTEKWVVSISVPQDLDREYSGETRHVTFDELSISLNELKELIEAFKRQVPFVKQNPRRTRMG
jgi:hypothetical protein